MKLLKFSDSNITIITSDTDYLQLIEPRVNIFNLKMKSIRTDKNSTGDSKKDLFIQKGNELFNLLIDYAIDYAP